MFGGFDRDSYDALGDNVFAPIRGETTLRWIGFYLCHDAAGGGSTWTARRPARSPALSTWRFLRSQGWGLAPLYLGRQFLPPLAKGGPARSNPAWTEAQGIIDGNHAIALTRMNNAGHLVDIESGATIYIDLENDGFVSVPAAQNYLRGWFDTVRGAGFRPGVYCAHPVPRPGKHYTSDGPLIRTLFPDVAIWFFRIPDTQPVVYNEQNAQLILNSVDEYRDADGSLTAPTGYIAAQYAWYNASRAVTGARLKTGPATFFNVAPIDFDAALVSDPSHPEDRTAVVFSKFKAVEPVVIFLTSDYIWWSSRLGGTWGDWVGGISDVAQAPLHDLGYGKWFDTRAVAAASRGEGLVDIFGLGVDGSLWTCWCMTDLVAKEDNWSGPAVIGGPRTARHGSAIAAVSRTAGALDVFFFNTNHELTNAYWRTDSPNWAAQTGPVTHGFNFHPASGVHPLVTAADSQRIDVFAVDWSNTVRWAQWKAPAPWQCVSVAINGSVDPAVGIQVAWHDGRIHLVAAMRDGTLAHLSHPGGNLATPWTSHGVLPTGAAGWRPTGFCMTAADNVLVVAAVATDQSLVWWGLEAGAWSGPSSNTVTPPYSSAGRVAGFPFDGNSVDVAVLDQSANFFYHRLTSGAAGSPPTLTETWRF